MIHWTIRAFSQIPEINDLVLVVHAREVEAIKLLIQPIISKDLQIIVGGSMRRDSAIAGVRAARGGIVLIHDGARPFPTKDLILKVIAATQQGKAAIPVLPVTDFLHHVDPAKGAITTLHSSDTHLARAQTPQGFHRELILQCLELAPSEIRDDASAVLLTGQPVTAIPGERTNMKVTRPEDLPLAEAIAAFREP